MSTTERMPADAPAPAPAIEARGLTKRYSTLTAVDALDLSIARGELFALLGTNGAGKSTTIGMLTGVRRPTKGDARIMGDSIVTQTAQAKAHLNVSPQETAVASRLSVRENIALIAGLYGQPRKKAQASAQAQERAFGLQDVSRQRAATLSGGMQRRLSIAMSMASNPEVLFLDEPTVGLDVYARHELWDAIEKLKGNVTILLTTHYMGEVEALADRVGVMDSGKLIASGTVEDLERRTKTTTLEDAFLALTGGGR
ncbi:MAG: ABC transporter ATP-binding protein [Bifidobacterium sp.]|nr:ABC transporter ATP-binding protein [Bifidobacterium sp.]